MGTEGSKKRWKKKRRWIQEDGDTFTVFLLCLVACGFHSAATVATGGFFYFPVAADSKASIFTVACGLFFLYVFCHLQLQYGSVVHSKKSVKDKQLHHVTGGLS